jgi:uncharacterized protein (DUF362 family)
VTDLLPYLEVLASQAHSDGGWGYASGQPAHLEPTCLALAALSLERDKCKDAVERGLQALRSCAGSDGGFRLARGREEAVWPTSLALFVQTALAEPADARERTAARLLALKGRIPDKSQATEVNDIDLQIVGWPWAEGNFSWAEPTAWACLALRHAGYGGHERVQEGQKMLLDRAFDQGGINYGNRKVLDLTTEPIPGPTALFLLALQGHAAHPRVAAAVQYLLKSAPAGADLEHLCWAKLALDLYRDQPGVDTALPQLDEQIRAAHHERETTNWVKPNPLRQALTALALGIDKGGNPFRLQNADCGLQNGKNGHHALLTTRHSPKRPWGERLRSAFRGLAVTAIGNLRQVAPQSTVHIARAPSYDDDLASMVRKQYETFRARVPLAGKRVVLKPNLVEYHRDKVINTNPKVVAAAIELCKSEGAAEIIVAEGPGHWRNVEYLVAASGLGDVLKHYKVPFIDINHDEPVKLPNLGRLTGLEYLYMSRTVATAEVLISMPKLKTHHWAGATLSMKNLFGTLPGICYGWPKNELHWRGIDNSIVDINLSRPPELQLVDGIVGMEGDGPLNGTAKPMGVLVMGSDPVATDATCCRLMKLDPERIAYIVLGARKKLGNMKEEQIQQAGESIMSLAQPFATVPHMKELCVG